MDCQTHKSRGLSTSAMILAVVGFCFTGPADLPAQPVIGPAWPSPPAYGWTVPQPVYVVPAPTVTTRFPPADDGTPSEQVSAAPLPDAHLRMTIAESLLSLLMGREVTDSGPIRDCFLGADVYGQQFTVTHLSVDCRPCATHARLQLQLTGSVVNQTVGVTRPAAVRSEGSHVFQMAKQVDFDGRQFTTRSPSAWVTPQIVYRDASTIVSGVPIIGQIGTAIALNQAERQRPAAIQYTLRRVTESAAPRFNQEVDRKLSDANRQLNTYQPAFFERWGLRTSDQFLMTTDDRLQYGLRIPPPAINPSQDISAASELSGPVLLQEIEDVAPVDLHETEPAAAGAGSRGPVPLAPPVMDGGSLTLMVHEDFVNHVIGRLSLGGREIPDRLIDQLLEALIDTLARMALTDETVDLSNPPEPEYATLLLDPDRPVSLRFDNGQAVLTLRTGLRVLVRGEVPTQQVEIPFHVSSSEQQITYEPGEVAISAASPDDEGPLMGLVRPVIRQQVEQRLQPFAVPRSIRVSIPEMTPVTLRVREVILEDGWLAVALDQRMDEPP